MSDKYTCIISCTIAVSQGKAEKDIAWNALLFKPIRYKPPSLAGPKTACFEVNWKAAVRKSCAESEGQSFPIAITFSKPSLNIFWEVQMLINLLHLLSSFNWEIKVS